MNKPCYLIILTFIFGFVFRTYPQEYSFLVAGHTYGAHDGENIGLHPPFILKLNQEALEDTTIIALFLTGDIVNHSNEESWLQVANELNGLPFPSYYSMGNHDDDETGAAVFIERFGNTWYSFSYVNDLFVVLNSTLSDRSISSEQLMFLENLLNGFNMENKRIFLFFHEVLWNSSEKYSGVMSNSRSRYGQIHSKSNFWDEVFPLFTNHPDKEFYCFSGDVGGNTDAISLFYDKIDNVTLLASGMGEVIDENYLKIHVLPDTVMTEIIPLNNEIEYFPIEYYSVPEAPDSIFGSTVIDAGESGLMYFVDPVFNASSYKWELPHEITGFSDINEILLSFGEDFLTDTIKVYAIHEGYGESLPASLIIYSDTVTNYIRFLKQQADDNFRVYLSHDKIFIQSDEKGDRQVIVSLIDVSGKVLVKRYLNLDVENFIKLPEGKYYILVVESGKGRSTIKICFR